MASDNQKRFLLMLMILMLLMPLRASVAEGAAGEAQRPYTAYALIEAIRPETPPDPFSGDSNGTTADFDAWWKARSRQLMMTVSDLDKIHAFTRNTARLILSGGGANRLYSPINSWRYLELLASLTEGNSRAQIEDVLGRALSAEDDELFEALDWDDGVSVCRLAASLWIDPQTHVSDELLSKLADGHHASVYQGPMGEESFNEALRAWLNEQTNDLLRDVVGDLGFDRETALSLCTTLYMRCPWDLPFSEAETAPDVFHAASGDIQADFMRKEQSDGIVYRGSAFSSVIMDLHGGGHVKLVLPDPDSSVEALLQTDELFDFLCQGKAWSDFASGKVTIRMPRVDILAQTPMNDALTRLGVTDVFDPGRVAFSGGLTSDHALSLTAIDQYARLIMDETGTEAASIILSDALALPEFEQDEIDFVLDRPFLFGVFSETNVPLFIGVCEAP